MILRERSSGVLLHVTSLPGPHGCGDCGPGAFHFVDWLHGAGQRLWQVLPLTPIGAGHSPYSSVSAFAGNPLLVALEPLVTRGWLELGEVPAFDRRSVDFEAVVPWRMQQLRAAAAGFQARASAAERAELEAWRARQGDWLDDYALFMALEAAHEGRRWWQWDEALARRERAALGHARQRLAGEIAFWTFVQWCFDAQWRQLKAYANAHGVSIMGDLPLFVAQHSADCWARPDLYQLDADFAPTVVAGVPPDAFSATGQRWGNPLYRWDRMAAEGWYWWIARMRRALEHADVVRIDHFRGFAACWEVPAASATAMDGRWVPGPGRAVFDAIASSLGTLPIVAEDLGVITPDVKALREGLGLPGMRILQFAFGEDATHDYLPHNHVADAVVYTGTHDNDTIRGWWDAALVRERHFAGTLLACGARDVHWAMIRAACTSVARTAIFPLQDVLGLPSAHRMNVPGEASGHWRWRFEWDMVGPQPGRVLGLIAAATGRGPFAPLRSAPPGG